MSPTLTWRRQPETPSSNYFRTWICLRSPSGPEVRTGYKAATVGSGRCSWQASRASGRWCGFGVGRHQHHGTR